MSNTERALIATAAILTLTIGIALVRKSDAARRARRTAPVVEAVVEFSPAELAARKAAQAARQAEARVKICREFEWAKAWTPGVQITPENIAQQQRYLDAVAADAAHWQLDAAIQAGLALMRAPATDAREYWRAAEIVSRTCAEPAKENR